MEETLEGLKADNESLSNELLRVKAILGIYQGALKENAKPIGESTIDDRIRIAREALGFGA